MGLRCHIFQDFNLHISPRYGDTPALLIALFETDIYEALSLETCVDLRNTLGGPGSQAMMKVLDMNENYLKDVATQSH